MVYTIILRQSFIFFLPGGIVYLPRLHISTLYVCGHGLCVLKRLKRKCFAYNGTLRLRPASVALNGVVMEFIEILMLSYYRLYRRLKRKHFAFIIGRLSFFRRVRSRPLGQAKPLYKNNSHPMRLILSDNRKRWRR